MDVGVAAIAHGQLLIFIRHRKKIVPVSPSLCTVQDFAAESIFGMHYHGTISRCSVSKV